MAHPPTGNCWIRPCGTPNPKLRSVPIWDVNCHLDILLHIRYIKLIAAKPASSDVIGEDDGARDNRDSDATAGYDETFARMIMEYICSGNLEASYLHFSLMSRIYSMGFIWRLELRYLLISFLFHSMKSMKKFISCNAVSLHCGVLIPHSRHKNTNCTYATRFVQFHLAKENSAVSVR